jgi:hypothetical protein
LWLCSGCPGISIYDRYKLKYKKILDAIAI